MPEWTGNIAAYLETKNRDITPMFVIFPDWTGEHWEEVCSRVHDAVVEAGMSFDGVIPGIDVRKGKLLPTEGYRQRTEAETLLFGRYNHDGLLLMPHQKEPLRPRPSWFKDHMLTPGPYSIGQKLIAISRRRIRNKVIGGRKTVAQSLGQASGQTNHTRGQTALQAVKQIALPAQDITTHSQNAPQAVKQSAMPAQSTAFAETEDIMTSTEQPSYSESSEKVKPDTMQGISSSRPLEDLTIHIGTTFELENEQLVMRRTLRDPKSWFDSSAPGTFDFEKVRRSVGVSAGWEKELFFFPDVTKDPHSILDEDELLGGIQHLYKQSVKERLTRSVSIFVAADISHVRALRRISVVSTIPKIIITFANIISSTARNDRTKCHCPPRP